MGHAISFPLVFGAVELEHITISDMKSMRFSVLSSDESHQMGKARIADAVIFNQVKYRDRVVVR